MGLESREDKCDKNNYCRDDCSHINNKAGLARPLSGTPDQDAGDKATEGSCPEPVNVGDNPHVQRKRIDLEIQEHLEKDGRCPSDQKERQSEEKPSDARQQNRFLLNVFGFIHRHCRTSALRPISADTLRDPMGLPFTRKRKLERVWMARRDGA